MIYAGMNGVRLNFSHGDQDYHRRLIGRLRVASKATGHRVAIMGDLPGPKIRIGEVSVSPMWSLTMGAGRAVTPSSGILDPPNQASARSGSLRTRDRRR
jgi:pyruvate kinase